VDEGQGVMAAAGTSTSVVCGRYDGERRWFYGGGVHTWKATAEQTNGAFLLFEMELERGKLTPLHSHPDSDETLYVLEGEILVHVDGGDHRVADGGLAMAARGVPHAFLVLSPVARVLCLHTPGCCQAFYLDASEPLADDLPSGQGSGPVDFGRIAASAERNTGIEILGPPPFAAAPV
jgi:quercetin dioxygenase-like cupin family protein